MGTQMAPENEVLQLFCPPTTRLLPVLLRDLGTSRCQLSQKSIPIADVLGRGLAAGPLLGGQVSVVNSKQQ